MRSLAFAAAHADPCEHTVGEHDIVRQSSQFRSLDIDPLPLEDSGQRVPVARFQLGVRGPLERLVRSDHDAGRALDFLRPLVRPDAEQLDDSARLPDAISRLEGA